MKTSILAIAVGVLFYSASVSEATPVRGFFNGVVTYNSNPSLLLPFLEGTPAWAIFGYDSDYLSPPDEFGNRYASPQEEYGGFFAAGIGGVGLVGFTTSDSGSLLIGPNGLPVGGNGAGPFDTFVFSNGFAVSTLDLSTYVVAEGRYSLPDHESTLPLTALGVVALAVARRFL